MALGPGTKLGHYEILSPLGAGGMGEVYRARDEKLDREVAVKVLSETLGSDRDALSRFEREAKAVAALSHPNILSIFDFGSQDGVAYAVMELLEGGTLRERLHAGPVLRKQAVDLALQTAKGLAAAHEKGIVHRDLKPGNLFVSRDGELKILDFGLAKRVEPQRADSDTEAPTASQHTVPGTVMGTAGYMSPEQVRGLPVDARSDLFSFGVVLYEMLTGERPFRGTTAADTMAAILTKDPPPLSAKLHDFSPALERVVARCLQKQPEARFGSARDLVSALQALGDHTLSGSEPTVTSLQGPARSRTLVRRAAAGAVLALLAAAGVYWLARPRPALSFAPRDWILVADVENETGEPVFDRSLFTALTVSLEQSRHANVLPRSRVAAALSRMRKDSASRIDAAVGREICLRENVRGLVTLNIAGAGGGYVLAARIVDPRTGESVRSFEEPAHREAGVLPALSSLAARIRESLGESLQAIRQVNRPLPEVTTASLRALELYARGKELWRKGQHHEAVKLYEASLEEDPEFAMAHAALGNAFASHIYNELSKGQASYARALQLASRTTDRERLLLQAAAANARGESDEAGRLYRAYLSRYPDDEDVRYSLGTRLMLSHRPSEALEQFQEVLRVAPSRADAHINMATTLSEQKRYPEALASYAKAFSLEPTWEVSANLNHEYGFALVAAGRVSKAREVFAKAVATKDLKPRGLRSLALLDLYEGRYREAATRLREAVLLNEAAQSPLSAFRDRAFLAAVLEGQGDRAAQLAELDRAKTLLDPLDAGVSWFVRLGVSYARAGRLDRAERLNETVAKDARPTSVEEMSLLHRLEGEIDMARGRVAAALEKVRLADRESQTAETLGSLARAAWSAKNEAEAVTAYEALLAMDCLGWEAQQTWVSAHYDLALAYREAGQLARAREVADRLLSLWKDADPDLPLLLKTRELRQQLDR